VRTVFAANGSALNLLGILRLRPPRNVNAAKAALAATAALDVPHDAQGSAELTTPLRAGWRVDEVLDGLGESAKADGAVRDTDVKQEQSLAGSDDRAYVSAVVAVLGQERARLWPSRPDDPWSTVGELLLAEYAASPAEEKAIAVSRSRPAADRRSCT
jgi:hypothetical protein